MMTNGSRREIAYRLRVSSKGDASWVVPWAIFGDTFNHTDKEVIEKLAELIGPSQLKPCPFCGAEARVIHTEVGAKVDCDHLTTCYLSRGFPKTFRDEDGFSADELAAKAWNERY